MIPALVAVLSAGGLVLAGALLRQPRYARDVRVQEHDGARQYGFDMRGMVD